MNETIHVDLSSQILGQFLRMQSIVWSLPDEKSIFSFVCKRLQDLPGGEEVCYAAEAESLTDPSLSVFSLDLGESNNGELGLKVVDPARFLPYRDYLKNFCFMLAVILEERKRRIVDADCTQQLEQHVYARTKALQESG